ncbi:diguanylate cyclase [Deinococcus sp. QL22]|uniref:sensor domain-containing diguanylate cyclase n=1 Tax=Deinococcus sp. QL22 TaxID=2939437 RepID=UPI002017FAA5|nr:sensor domain-containing diguanylate cyclase [Deinococcus sp. QL22]UQN05293.1 sensor domain-containing diguanylate cyclase [Deinococcus sp. QL22]
MAFTVSKPDRSTTVLTPAQASRAFSWTRFLILLALLLIQVGTVTGVLWANRRGGEAVVQAQARQSLQQLVRVTGDNARAYLQTAVQIVRITTTMIASGQTNTADSGALGLTFGTLLEATPQLDAVLLGQPDGRFVFVRRDGTGRYFKVIEPVPQRCTTITYLDAAGRVTSQTTPADSYDPRTRPWYMLATSRPGQMVWTAPYVFASSQLPGITVAAAQQGLDGRLMVVGVDMQLSGLTHMLEQVKFTPRGRAFITDTDGNAIAASRAWPRKIQGRVPALTEVGDPALHALLDGGGLPRLEGEEGLSSEVTRRYLVGTEPYAAVLRRVEVQPGISWVVGVYAPESDFTGELNGVFQQHLIIIAVMAVLSALIAWPLAFSATQPFAALQRQATTDALTGLRNRASLLAQLSEDLRRKATNPHAGELGVVILDLDGFKAVNDTYGHAVGDEVLHAVGASLLSAARVGDTLGRLGGDEFALIVHGATREAVRLRVEGIMQAIVRRPMTVNDVPHQLGATAGLVFYDQTVAAPSKLEEIEEASHLLLLRADTALLRGKKREKGRVWLADELGGPTLL